MLHMSSQEAVAANHGPEEVAFRAIAPWLGAEVSARTDQLLGAFDEGLQTKHFEVRRQGVFAESRTMNPVTTKAGVQITDVTRRLTLKGIGGGRELVVREAISTYNGLTLSAITSLTFRSPRLLPGRNGDGLRGGSIQYNATPQEVYAMPDAMGASRTRVDEHMHAAVFLQGVQEFLAHFDEAARPKDLGLLRRMLGRLGNLGFGPDET